MYLHKSIIKRLNLNIEIMMTRIESRKRTRAYVRRGGEWKMLREMRGGSARKRKCASPFPSVLSSSRPPSHPSPLLLFSYPSFASLPSHRRKVINTLGRCVGEAHTPVGRDIAGVLCANLTIRLFFRGTRTYGKESPRQRPFA